MSIFKNEKLYICLLMSFYVMILEKKPSVATVRVHYVVVGLGKIQKRRSVIEKKEKKKKLKRREKKGDEMLKNFWKIWM